VYNTTAWLLTTVKHTFVTKADDQTKVSERWFTYDNHLSIDDQPTKGDLTKEVTWLNTQGASNPVTQHAYDSFGNQVSVTDANSHTTTTAFDPTGTYPVSTTNAKTQTSTMTYDLGTSNLLTKTDPNGFTTSYEYDVFGRLTKEIKPYDTSSFPTVSYQYFTDGIAPEGTLVAKRETSGAAGTLDTYTWIDGVGRTIQTRTESEDPGQRIVTDTFYDPTGNVLKETVPAFAPLSTTYQTPATGTRSTVYSYDPLARVTIITNPKGDSKTRAYDHWKETSVDEKGHIKREFKNAFGKITRVEEVLSGVTIDTEYTYNTLDNLTKITDAPGNETTFTYDSLGRKKSQTDPDMGTWQYEYDGIGNLTKQMDNRGVAKLMTYDELDRLTKTDHPTDIDVVYSYDGNSKIGTLTSVTDAAGTVTFSYDNRLRKIQESRVMDGVTWTTQFAYDALDRVTTQTKPDSKVLASTFNPQGEVNSVTGILSNIDYNALGKITKKEFGNGLTTNYTYTTDDFRPQRIHTGTVQDLAYTYDAVGNITAITNSLLNKTQAFT
jgi:YD repeat-containing protein